MGVPLEQRVQRLEQGFSDNPLRYTLQAAEARIGALEAFIGAMLQELYKVSDTLYYEARAGSNTEEAWLKLRTEAKRLQDIHNGNIENTK